MKDIFVEAQDLKTVYSTRTAGELERKEIIALMAYLQRLGTDIRTNEIKTASTN